MMVRMIGRIASGFLLVLTCSANPLDAEPARRLEICPRHPYYFRDGERHVVLLGVSDRALFSVWKNDKGFDWRKYLDELQTYRLNYVRQDVCSWGALRAAVDYPAQFSSPAWPFERTGPGKAVDGKPRFDLTRLDGDYFEGRLRPFLREAGRRGVYVELTLFEGFRKRSFAESLYADTNSVNQLGLEPRQATSDAALDHPRLMAIQHGYVDRVLAETASSGNVIYEIANETGGPRWVAHFIDYIHHHREHPSQLVSAGEQTSAFDPRRGANDIVVKHRGKAGPYASHEDLQSHRAALLRYRVGKPVSHNEYFLYVNRSTDDVHFPRKMMWVDFTAGGHSNLFDFSYWRGTGRTLGEGQPSRSPPGEILQGGLHLQEFIRENDVRFWSMAPRDKLATIEGGGKTKVFTLARPGAEYVCYLLGDGPVTVRLDLTMGTFEAGWFDPREGKFLASRKPVRGGKGQRFVSPRFRQDIVLHVRAADQGKRESDER